MSEKEMFIQTWEREFQTTLKVLKAYPPEKLDIKPHERSRSAKELAWTFVNEEGVIDGITKGKIDFQNRPKPPATFEEIVGTYEKMHKELVNKVKDMPDADLNKTVEFFVAPKQMGQVRRGDLMWMMVMDSVHHRGQLSVYLRLAGAKVPSIYGPTADEPWM
jgi:uncharacterized damage-inducible protein DinB